MQTKRISTEPLGKDEPEFLTDPEGQRLLNLGATRFAELQKLPGFPRPVWLGPRGKRFVRQELVAWALAQRQAPRTEAAQ